VIPRADVGIALLGEADVLAGQVLCPRSPLDTVAKFGEVKVDHEDWVVPGVCAYVPQVSFGGLMVWLSSDSLFRPLG